MRTSAVALIMGLFMSVFAMSIAFADSNQDWITAGQYEKGKSDPKLSSYINVYLFAAGGAFIAANASLEASKQPLLFCVPRTLSLTGQNYIDIFEGELQKLRANEVASTGNAMIAHYQSDGFPDEFVLLQGLKNTFPCDKSK